MSRKSELFANILLSMIAVSVAGACAASPAGAGEVEDTLAGESHDKTFFWPRVRIAWLGNDPSNTYDNANRDASAVVAFLMNASLTPFYSGWDPEVQLDQCYGAIRSGRYDALIILAADPIGIVPCVEEAGQRGIPVVASDLQIGPDPTTVEPQVPGQVGAVLVPPAKWGAELGALVTDLCASRTECNVVYLAGSFGVALDQIAIQELEEVDAAHSHIELVATAEAFYDRATAYGIAHDLLSADSNVHVIVGAGDQMAQGVEEAIADLGLVSNGIDIVGAGAGAYGVQAVRDGRWHATFMALPADQGVHSAFIAIMAARGLPILDAGIDAVELRGYDAFFTEDNQNDFFGFIPQWPG